MYLKIFIVCFQGNFAELLLSWLVHGSIYTYTISWLVTPWTSWPVTHRLIMEFLDSCEECPMCVNRHFLV